MAAAGAPSHRGAECTVATPGFATGLACPTGEGFVTSRVAGWEMGRAGGAGGVGGEATGKYVRRLNTQPTEPRTSDLGTSHHERSTTAPTYAAPPNHTTPFASGSLILSTLPKCTSRREPPARSNFVALQLAARAGDNSAQKGTFTRSITSASQLSCYLPRRRADTLAAAFVITAARAALWRRDFGLPALLRWELRVAGPRDGGPVDAGDASGDDDARGCCCRSGL